MTFRVVLVKLGETEDRAQDLGRRPVTFTDREILIQNREEIFTVPALAEVISKESSTLIDCVTKGEQFTLHLTPLDKQAEQGLRDFLAALSS